MKDYFSKTFLIYILKWQAGIIVTVPCMYVFKDLLQFNNITTTILFQLIGAIIFFKLDKYIFQKVK